MTIDFSSADDADDADFFLNSPLKRGNNDKMRKTLHAASLRHCTSIINYQLIQIMENNKTLWSKILNILITVLTAIATTFTTTSCIDML